MRRRALSLLGTMWMLAALSTVSLLGIASMEMLHHRLRTHQKRLQAACHAMSGRNYARILQQRRRTGYRSPLLPQGGYFEVHQQPDGSWISIGVVGRCRSTWRGRP